MIKFIKELFNKDCKEDDSVLWYLAEALLWRDNNASVVNIPAPIKEQPDAQRYYDDAVYIAEFVKSQLKHPMKRE